MDKQNTLTLSQLDEILTDKLHDTPWTPEARKSVKVLVDLLQKDGFTLRHTFNNEWEVTIVLERTEHVYYIGRAKDLHGTWLTYIQHSEKQSTH